MRNPQLPTINCIDASFTLKLKRVAEALSRRTRIGISWIPILVFLPILYLALHEIFSTSPQLGIFLALGRSSFWHDSAGSPGDDVYFGVRH